MTDTEPKFITFDMYGTLTHFQMAQLTRELVADIVPADQMDEFIDVFRVQRIDEILGPWKPYPDVVRDSLRKALERMRLPYRAADGDALVDAVPTWGPHPDVPDALRTLASRFPLVILTNAADSQVEGNVRQLGAPFHAVYTSEQAGAYKPRFQAFDYLLEQLDVGPGEILHVSSSLRHDLIPAHDLRITNKVYVNRGYEPSTPYYGYREVTTLTEVPALLGI
ncbi:putative hydrolase [Nostocoides japonicum T1-X7]|uniref:Putative hydrolase n=1 Tax=Nostocoides japonicum T1-X7 TaxID=1194083 RepID=A0A077M813_9MICO|nr:haloacid dehalogenase type II [Tetrasphaera japonica]CCH80214.1 putative hydrolase [Tetrasphaera japonica T1-X7]